MHGDTGSMVPKVSKPKLNAKVLRQTKAATNQQETQPITLEMAESLYQTEQLPASEWLESAGCILFDFRHTGIDPRNPPSALSSDPAPPEPNIVFFYSSRRQETLLAKGRRNISESRSDAAVRETFEETGLKCHLLPVTLHSRATSVDPAQDRVNAGGFTTNEVRTFKGTCDAFMMTMRHYPVEGLKLIWWYIGIVDDEQPEVVPEIDPGCEIVSVPMSQAAERLTFKKDREIVIKAIEVMQETLGVRWIS